MSEIASKEMLEATEESHATQQVGDPDRYRTVMVDYNSSENERGEVCQRSCKGCQKLSMQITLDSLSEL